MQADTYFFNAQEALRVASEQNTNETQSLLQVCYYSGEIIDSPHPNLINISIENLVEDLATGICRLPTKLDFTGLELSENVRNDIEVNFMLSLSQAKEYREQFKALYFKTLKNAKPDFSEKLRFYIPADASSRVMQHISKNVANALEEAGCEVLYDLNIGITDPNVVKKAAQFNPHAIFNINHLNNAIISDDVFNFVWVQDIFAIQQFKVFKLRKKDILYHLIKSFYNELYKLGIQSTAQNFCIDTQVYKHRESIQREKKIVLIATSYIDDFNSIKHKDKDEIARVLLDDYIYERMNTEKKLRNNFIVLREKYKIDHIEFGKIVRYVERDGFLLHIISMNLSYDLEVYGWGWDKVPEVSKYYKGILSYGEEISKVYNTAIYTLVLGGYVLQQRTLESAASGCIPLVYDSRHNTTGNEDSDCIEKSVIFFSKPDDIRELLEIENNCDLNCIVEENSYISFAQKMIEKVQKNS